MSEAALSCDGVQPLRLMVGAPLASCEAAPLRDLSLASAGMARAMRASVPGQSKRPLASVRTRSSSAVRACSRSA